MRIVISEFISLDGVVQAPGGLDEDRDGGFGHGGWSHPFFDPEVVGGAFAGALADAEALLFGRRTWQTMAAAWPERAGDPFADRMNSLPKYVVSGTLGEADLTWQHTRLVPAAEAVARIGKLRAGDGGDLLVMGSPTLVRSLLSEGLVDELRLVVLPVLLGGGKSIFPEDGGLRTLELVSVVTASTGANVCTYRAVAA
ncbi:dihydrofolate reductase family protein [Streptomyces sp. NPDC046161]|uniref:dihydrofolate reductase family protein n=1 Tax=Streptomyces sp. NPDC046161 TaxID=3155132 RepID=UPI0033C2F49C